MRIRREDLERNRAGKERRKESEFLLYTDFEQYLSDRYFYDNPDKDFSAKDCFPLTEFRAEDNQHTWYRFHMNDREFEVGKIPSEDYSSGFGNIYLTDTKAIYPWKYRTCYGICSEYNNTILILPYFNSVRFYEQFNVFVCATSFKDTVEPETFLEQMYYFDTKGRFIKQQKRSSIGLFPDIAVIDNEIKEIKLDGFSVEEVCRYNLFVVCIIDSDNVVRKQVIDNAGNSILDKAYLDVVVRTAEETIFVVDENEIICFDTAGNKKRTYPGFNHIDEVGENSLRIGKKSEEKTVFSIISCSGEQMLKKTYDFVEKCPMSKNFKFFQGNWYSFTGYTDEIDPEIEIVQSKLNKIRTDISVYRFHPNGQWGIINENEDIILQGVYSWIEEMNENVFLLNEGGRLLRCSRCVDEWDLDSVDEFIVHGGKWFTYHVLDAKYEATEIEYDSNNFINSVYKIE
ncbi:hypothetical protein P2W68_05470 [Chryseobacterium arthrosphaerae]|uniref:hypothetical protein n=1 Tax=Chryseobacterium arthrosphaerae TaxID=651561 RepID=UPI0023E2D7CE|nr:hypothetical protein [Chryseobacterium arthrosphaerae]WES99064.1 hypothetical protein P2W68_05470 [Chryseobacterium arthrosphaerae]